MTQQQRSLTAASLAVWISRDRPPASEIQATIESALRDVAYRSQQAADRYRQALIDAINNEPSGAWREAARRLVESEAL